MLSSTADKVFLFWEWHIPPDPTRNTSVYTDIKSIFIYLVPNHNKVVSRHLTPRVDLDLLFMWDITLLRRFPTDVTREIFQYDRDRRKEGTVNIRLLWQTMAEPSLGPSHVKETQRNQPHGWLTSCPIDASHTELILPCEPWGATGERLAPEGITSDQIHTQINYWLGGRVLDKFCVKCCAKCCALTIALSRYKQHTHTHTHFSPA